MKTSALMTYVVLTVLGAALGYVLFLFIATTCGQARGTGFHDSDILVFLGMVVTGGLLGGGSGALAAWYLTRGGNSEDESD